MRENPKEQKSYLTISMEEVQDIINDKNLYKDYYLNDKDQQVKVVVECDKNIGFVYDKDTGRKVSTNRATIHFSKTGTHLVPTNKRGDY